MTLVVTAGFVFVAVAVHATPPTSADDTTQPDGQLVPVQGGTREATAGIGASVAYPSGASTVYLARSDTFPDALASGALTNGPLLLVPPGNAAAEARDSIERIGPTRVVVIGGVAGVSDAAARDAAGGRTVDRVAGADRYATAVAVSHYGFPFGADAVYLARADAFADALSAGSLPGGPILLVPHSGTVPPEVISEVDRLAPDEVFVLGGPSAIPDDVAVAASSGRRFTRLAGQDRYATSVEIAGEVVGQDVVVASGENFPDGLIAGFFDSGPVLLVPRCGTVPTSTLDVLAARRPARLFLIGGSAAICNGVVEQVAAAAHVKLAPPLQVLGDRTVSNQSPSCGERDYSPVAWPSGDIVYSWISDTDDYPLWKDSIVAAMHTWEAAVGVGFVPRNESDRPSDLVIGFFRAAHEPQRERHASFDEAGGLNGNVLAHASIGSEWSGRPEYLHFDDFEWWTDLVKYPDDVARGARDLQTTALHELGHVLGLRHTGNTEDVMYCSSVHDVFRGLSANDIALARALYPEESSEAPPTPTATITLAQGGPSTSGYWYSFTASGFTQADSLSLVCHDSVDPQGFYVETFDLDASGSASDSTLCFSGDGPDHWVTGGGVESNHVNWGGGSTQPPPSAQTWSEQNSVNHASNTFSSYHNASGVGPQLAAGQWVEVSCKVYDPTIASVNPDGYWYRIASSPWNNAYYAPANVFMNGDPPGGPYTHNTDFAVADC